MMPNPKKSKKKQKVFGNFIFLEEQNLAFGYVPKVACTNWKVLIRRLQGHSDYENKQIAHDRKKSGFRFLDYTSESDYQILMNDNVKKIAFVRNPYSRVLSAYLDKIDRINEKKNNAGNNDHFVLVYNDIVAFREATLKSSLTHKLFGRFMRPKEEPVDFLTFLKWIKAKRSYFGLAQDEHWTPQTEILQYPEVKIDFLGHFEDLENDAKVALEMMGANFDFPNQNEIGFKATGASTQMQKYYGKAHISLVDELYSSDFDAYGYKRGKVD